MVQSGTSAHALPELTLLHSIVLDACSTMLASSQESKGALEFGFVLQDRGKATVGAKMLANCPRHFTSERFSARPPLVLSAHRQAIPSQRGRTQADHITFGAGNRRLQASTDASAA